MIPPIAQELSTTEQILTACHGLFYARGLRAVSMDHVATAAGLTKRTLYYHFKSKDLLIEAWLDRRAEIARQETRSIQGTALERLQEAFRRLEPQVSHPAFRGCPFVNAVAELADSSHPAVAVARQYKNDRLEWFSEIVAELGKPESLAAIVMILWEGAIARAVVDRGPTAVKDANNAAIILLSAP
jgi:AcrR family transcriptional regulator